MKMRHLLIALPMLLGTATAANAEISVGISLPGVNIGVNMPMYPQLVPVPGYPVYYDPRADSNYFFYDGLYWVFQDDNWYASDWYNGPWQLTEPDYVPLYVLRVPVRYYHRPPVYFRSWRADAPPRWGDHWGHEWEQRRSGWDRWDRRSVPAPAPLPTYQRQYSGSNYPRAAEQQHAIRSEHYRYQPREPITQQHFQQRGNAGGERADQQRSPQQRLPQQRQQQERQQQERLPQQPMQQQRAQPAPQPMQAQPRMQHPQPEPQERGRDNRAEPQERGRDNRAEPQERSHDSRPEPQGRGRGNRQDPQDREREGKNEERSRSEERRVGKECRL